ncbi:MAG: hypothetical protein ACI37Z_05215 [Candidatus Gastranaerophilaceae bacterium]
MFIKTITGEYVNAALIEKLSVTAGGIGFNVEAKTPSLTRFIIEKYETREEAEQFLAQLVLKMNQK